MFTHIQTTNSAALCKRVQEKETKCKGFRHAGFDACTYSNTHMHT